MSDSGGSEEITEEADVLAGKGSVKEGAVDSMDEQPLEGEVEVVKMSGGKMNGGEVRTCEGEEYVKEVTGKQNRDQNFTEMKLGGIHIMLFLKRN